MKTLLFVLVISSTALICSNNKEARFDLQQFATQEGAEYYQSNAQLVVSSEGFTRIIVPEPSNPALLGFMFWLQGANVDANSFRSGEIVYGNGFLIFRDNNAQNLTLFALSNQYAEVAAKVPATQVVTSAQGFGLSKISFKGSNLGYDNFVANYLAGNIDIAAAQIPCKNGGEPACNNGGCGAVECSADSGVAGYDPGCSVKCADGYYACCHTSSSCGCFAKTCCNTARE